MMAWQLLAWAVGGFLGGFFWGAGSELWSWWRQR